MNRVEIARLLCTRCWRESEHEVFDVEPLLRGEAYVGKQCLSCFALTPRQWSSAPAADLADVRAYQPAAA